LVLFFFQARDGDRTHAIIYFLNVHIQNFAHVARSLLKKRIFNGSSVETFFQKGLQLAKVGAPPQAAVLPPTFET